VIGAPVVDFCVEKIVAAEAVDLIAELDRYQAALYPRQSNHFESASELSQPHVQMYGCRIQQQLVAIGAVKIMSGYGEIKRLYVAEGHRGLGLARAVMNRLERAVREHDVALARLETGVHQQQALQLYRKLGYVRCEAFGDYRPDPLSVFMQKQL